MGDMWGPLGMEQVSFGALGYEALSPRLPLTYHCVVLSARWGASLQPQDIGACAQRGP